MLVWLAACEDPAREARLARIEARMDALEEEPSEGPTAQERLDGLEARIDALLPQPAPPSASAVVVGPDGRVSAEPTADTAERCAYDVLSSVRTAELSYDAAFDGFSTDMRTIGWEWDRTTGCDALVAFRPVTTNRGFTITAVITRGGARTRRFEIDTTGAVYERARYAEEELAKVRNALGWYGAEP